MATVYEVVLIASHIGNPHNNVFHVWDGADDDLITDIADYFDNNIVTNMLPLLTSQFVYTGISVKSITAVNPGEHFKVISKAGTNPDDPLPTGIHINVKLKSADAGFKSGGKLVSGWVETQFTGGEPSALLLDNLQTVYDSLIAGFVPAGLTASLAIYRPSLSLPGLPQISIVSEAVVRGDSTTNRRAKKFERAG